MHLPTGTLLQGGKYRIVRFINSGGFGCTYEAVHTVLESRVAIKEFFVKEYCNRDEPTGNVSVGTTSKRELISKLRRKFIDEAKAVFNLVHPGIVHVIDVFEERGTAYYVMDYIEGHSLEEILAEQGPLSEAVALDYMRQLCAALNFVHMHNRLHLDIKPGNIMIDKQGKVILIDFGVSKQYDEENGENTSTLVGRTPGYAPPEQMDNDVIDFLPSTDIYSLGATFYKALTGVTPLSGNRLNSGDENIPLPQSITPATRRAIEAAMVLNKRNRPQSIAEFTAILDNQAGARSLATMPMPHKPSDAEPQVVKPASGNTTKGVSVATPGGGKRRIVLIAALCVVLIAGVTGIITFTGSDKPTDNEADTTLIAQAVDVSDSDSIAAETYEVTEEEPATEDPSAANAAEPLAMPTPAAEHTTVQTPAQTPEPAETPTAPTRRSLTPATPATPVATTTTTPVTTAGNTPEQPRTTTDHSQTTPAGAGESPTIISNPTGTVAGHGYVDLGLSVKWATCNVGGSNPSDYGSYFSWGEINTKEDYSSSALNGRRRKENEIIGNAKYDAARAKWGGTWRLPTAYEIDELLTDCTWTWTTIGGIKGYKVTGKRTGNSIFLPAAGYREENSLRSRGSFGYFWSGTPDKNSYLAWYLCFNNGGHTRYAGNRYCGYPIRAVTP